MRLDDVLIVDIKASHIHTRTIMLRHMPKSNRFDTIITPAPTPAHAIIQSIVADHVTTGQHSNICHTIR